MSDVPPEVVRFLLDVYCLGKVDPRLAEAEFSALLHLGYREGVHRDVARRIMNQKKEALNGR